MSTQDKESSSTFKSSSQENPVASSTLKTSTASNLLSTGAYLVAPEHRYRWWLDRIEGAPILRHLSLWWKLVRGHPCAEAAADTQPANHIRHRPGAREAG
jgi:hypothetical protein